MSRRIRHAFTLVELLVVITIIGILMGLLIPAVNAAREAARKNTCSVNMKNLALAAFQYESSKGKLPSYLDKYGVFGAGGGTGPAGDPTDPGSDAVPNHIKVGGYGVAILPWIDAQPTYEHWTQDRYPIIDGANGERDGSSSVGASDSGAGFHELAGPNLAIFQCPSNPITDANQGRNSYVSNNGLSYLVGNGNSGFSPMPNTAGTPPLVPFEEIQSKNNTTGTLGYAGYEQGSNGNVTPYYNTKSKVRMSDIKDGQGFTVLYSENVQALPWYLPGLVNADSMVAVQNVSSNAVAQVEWDASNANVFQALQTGAYSAGFVWHLEDNDVGNFVPVNHQFKTGVTGTVTEVDAQHKINGRAASVSDDIFVKQMDLTNYVDLARPSSAHVEGVNMGFADGATRYILESIDYRVYQALMTPRGKSSDVPWPEFVLTDEITL